MSVDGNELLDILSKLSAPVDDEKLARIISYVDNHGRMFDSEDIKAIRTKLLEVTGFDQEGLLEAFERGYLKKHYTPRQDDFSHLLPTKGLVSDFVTLTRNTEWPTPYRAYSILTVIGAVLGRQVYVDRNMYKVWPNLAVILIGPSGIRKTTSTNYAIRMAREAVPDRFHCLERSTGEGIHSWLAQRNPAVGLMYAPELATVINKKDYTRNLIQDLTRLWDCPDELPVVRRSDFDKGVQTAKEVLYNVALSFLGASNEEWLLKSLPEDAHKGGFLPRMLQVYVGGFEKIVSLPKAPDQSLYMKCIDALVRMQLCYGAATLTRQGELFFHKRYTEVHSEMFGYDPRIAAFMSRYGDHLLRLGLLLSVAESQTPSVQIGDEHLEIADGLLKWQLKWLPKIYALTGLTDVGEDSRRVLHVLQRSGGRLSRRRLIGELYGRIAVGKLDEILRTLIAADFVRAVPNVLFEDGPLYYNLTERALKEV